MSKRDELPDDPLPTKENVQAHNAAFANLSMPKFLRAQAPAQLRAALDADGGELLTSIELAARHSDPDEARQVIDQLREDYFTAKYADYAGEVDARPANWEQELYGIYRTLGFDLAQSDILYVGVGNGSDLAKVCPEFRHLTGVDLSQAMLASATRQQPRLRPVHASAETLAGIADQSVDLYLSMRAFQSSLLDQPAALRQAWRVLRPRGGLVLSIPAGYVRGDGTIIPGLLRPDGFIDPDLPHQIAGQLTVELQRCGFAEAGWQHAHGDVFVWAHKADIR